MGSGTLVPVKFYSFPRSRYSHYFFVLADRYILEEKENNNKKRGPTLRREVFTTVSQLPICFSFSLFFFSPGNQLDGHSKWYVCPSVQVWWESTSYGNRGFFKKKRTRRRKYNTALEENHLCCVPFRPETDVLLSNGCHGNMAPPPIHRRPVLAKLVMLHSIWDYWIKTRPSALVPGLNSSWDCAVRDENGRGGTGGILSPLGFSLSETNDNYMDQSKVIYTQVTWTCAISCCLHIARTSPVTLFLSCVISAGGRYSTNV